MSSAKEEELKGLWREVVRKEQKKKVEEEENGEEKEEEEVVSVSVSGLKNQVTMITKNASTTRKMYEVMANDGKF